MVAVPEIVDPPEFVKEALREHFDENEQTYRKVWERLDEVRYHWDTASKPEKEAMLKMSYINSVLSIKTPLETHEAGLESFLLDGETLYDAMVNNGLGIVDREDWYKYPKMQEALRDDGLWSDLVDMLNTGQVDKAQRRLLDDAGWVGAAKSPFTLANLGFVQKMCIDSNVGSLMGMESQPDTPVVEKYEGLCADIRDLFPDLAEQMAPYELQWLLFDFNRMHIIREDSVEVPPAERPVTRHDNWFEIVTSNFDSAIQAVQRETDRAKGIDPDVPETPSALQPADVDAEIEDAIADAVERGMIEADVQDEIEQAVKTAVNGGD